MWGYLVLLLVSLIKMTNAHRLVRAGCGILCIRTIPCTDKMKLKNNFNEQERYYWQGHEFCAECRSNQNLALHHIYGRRYSSILNSIPLCIACHSKYDGMNTDGIKGDPHRKKFLAHNLKWIMPQGKVFNEDDIFFITEKQKDFNDVLIDNKGML